MRFTEGELEWLEKVAERHRIDIKARPEFRDQANVALLSIHRYVRVGGFLDKDWRPPRKHVALLRLFCDWALTTYRDIYADTDSDLETRLNAHQQIEMAQSVKRKLAGPNGDSEKI